MQMDISVLRTGLVPTRRAVVDLNRVCNAKCLMCYYAHSNEKWSKSIETVKKELVEAKKRGNTSVDFTGGEPTIYPHMEEAIEFAEGIGLHTCVITNGLAVDRIRRIIDAGCREWLLSVHGYGATQDKVLNVQGAWKRISDCLEVFHEKKCFVRVNCTLTKLNAKELPKLALFFVKEVKARVVNFINFNPHYEWGKKDQPEVFKRLNKVQVKVKRVAPFLRTAIDILNANNTWVNVRYFPFCALKGYETHICNNPQVMFDPFEWDYGVHPKTVERYLQFARELQRRINSREGRCSQCGIVDVCGGVHRNYAKIHGYEEMEPYSLVSDYPYQFKKDLTTDIVVPVYQPNHNLNRLLEEISQKTIPPYNLIVTCSMRSASINRNEGLNRSLSPYVIMCDDDIVELPFGWNRRLLYTLKENPEYMAVSARLMNPDGTPGINVSNNYQLDPDVVETPMIPTACCIFRNTGVRFDPRFIRAGWEDTDFFMELATRYGGKFAIDNRVKVVHLNEEKNDGGAGNLYNRRIFMEKWGVSLSPKNPKRSEAGRKNASVS